MALPIITALPTPPSRSDSPTDFVTAADAFLGAFPTLQSEINAWAAALPASITGTDFSGSSTTSVAIGTGSKAFTASTGKQWQIGQSVRVAYTTTPANYMDGQVTAYNSTTGALTVNVTSVGGAGTQALWTISLLPGGAGSYATLTGLETLTNKTLTAPIIATISNSGTVTVPTGTRTLVARDTTDTLTNKTIDTAGPNTIKINGNTLAASAGTATLTFPNVTGTLATLAGTETLTGKTFSGDTLNADNVVNDTGTIATNSVGFRGVPASANGTGTLALADNGKMIVTTSNQTIPANASVAFPIGAVVEIANSGGATLTIAITTDTLRWSGTTSTGARTLAAYGRCWVQKITSTVWYVAGDIS